MMDDVIDVEAEIISQNKKCHHLAIRTLPKSCRPCKFRKFYVEKRMEAERQERKRKERREAFKKRLHDGWQKAMDYKIDTYYFSIPIVLFALIFVLGPLGLFVIGAYLVVNRGSDMNGKEAI